MPAVDALTMRTFFTEQLDNLRFQSYVDIMCDLTFKQNFQLRPREGAENPEAFRKRFDAGAMRRALAVAETYYVSPDMHELAFVASQDFPEDEVILKEDQPSEAGFIMFPSRFRLLDMRGALQIIHGCLWLNSRLWLVVDEHDPEDEISQKIREQDGLLPGVRYSISAFENFGYGVPLPHQISFGKNVLPSGATVRFGYGHDGKTSVFTDHVVDAAPVSKPDPFMRFMLAIWRLMQQTLSDVSVDEDHPKYARRAAERAHVPTAVTIISLRRRKGQVEDAGGTINYQTIVRGHWRRVWCGPKDGERYQRAVYIHPFWRGPEGAPIIIRDRINALVR